jgi:hypothetical protein
MRQAALYLDDNRAEKRCVLVYALYAARPPPPGALEDADLTDDEDLYDWYTWPRAEHVLRGSAPALSTLRTLACSLATAASAGRLPIKWGGVFGQEWLSTAASTARTTSQLPQLPQPAPSAPSAPKSAPPPPAPLRAPAAARSSAAPTGTCTMKMSV